MEGREGIDNIGEILNIKELDIVFIGVFDISKSLGIPGDVQNPKVKKILRSLTDKINYSGKYPGSIVNSVEEMQEFIELGVKYITYSVDCHVLKTEYSQISSIFRKLLPCRIEND